MLPHARVGGIAGLIEFSAIAAAAKTCSASPKNWSWTSKTCSPFSKPACCSGFAWLKEGDVQLSPQASAFADADIQARKVLFRQAVLEHVTILKQIDSILKRKSDHAMADEFFNDILDEHFAEDEVQRQFETATNWGRYAEIFDYDRERTPDKQVGAEAPAGSSLRQPSVAQPQLNPAPKS
jgi:NitT/TauT family transport system ATP-binding protein